jgi:hypothetical protein
MADLPRWARRCREYEQRSVPVWNPALSHPEQVLVVHESRVKARVCAADSYAAAPTPGGRLGRIRAGTQVSRRTVGLQDEDLDRQVRIDVVLAHEGDHLAPGGVLDGSDQFVAHHHLKIVA